MKRTGALLLIAGTCIGSGMIALPMVLAKLGLIPSVLLMLFIWSIMYYTSLINIELNLQAGQGLSLGALGRHYSGWTAELIGTISIKLLSYSLLAVFIYGGSSILQKLTSINMVTEYSFHNIALAYAIIVMGILLLPIKIIDYVNRLLFLGLLAVVAILITGLALAVNWSNLPLFYEHYSDVTAWATLIPVVFTSFGFQVIFHTMTEYCDKNKTILKQAFLWGSLIPAIVYILWTCSILGVVYNENPAFYHLMAEGKVEIGELIHLLSGISKWESNQLLVWCVSILAITTSVVGVGKGLCDTLNSIMLKAVPNVMVRRILSSIITVIPAYAVAVYVPNAFIVALGFAGMILAIIAILLPIYLFRQIEMQKLHYLELKRKWLILLSLSLAVIVIVSEIYNML